MDMKTAVITCLTKYVDFDGRASRSEFWWFFLFELILFMILSMMPSFIDTIAALALVLPSLGSAVRRLHDIGKSGWWIFINLIPLIGTLIYLYWSAKPSQHETNNWGAPPTDTSA
jgi:uncharacterized membrane protein YhaH (DUF805 family)